MAVPAGFGEFDDVLVAIGDRLARKPAALVVGVEDFKIAAFDFDDQPHLFRELELVTMILRPAIDKIADVDWAGLHPRLDDAV